MSDPGNLESVFIEIICPNTSNLIIGCLYKHTLLHIGDFNRNCISPLLHKLSKKSSKQIFLLHDFNIDLLKYESSELVNSFLDTLSSNFLSPQIILPTRISSSSTLIDNIFFNLTHTTKSVSGNLRFTSISNFTRVFQQCTTIKIQYLHTIFDKKKFIFKFNSQDWDNSLVLEKENVNETIDHYLQNIDSLLENHAPLKKVSKRKV